jgi:hemolysin activation/secretion protein
VSGLQRFKRAITCWSAAAFILTIHTAFAWSGDEPTVSAPEAPVAAAPTMEAQEGAEQAAEPATATPQNAEPPAELTFEVTSYRVEGNTLLDSAQIDATLTSFTGPQMKVADVDRARLALEALYHDAGYPAVIVSLPEQTVENGVVQLQVMESKLAEVTVSGNRYISTQRLLGKLPSISPGAILHEPTILADLDAVNATPDRQVAPVLTVGSEPGTVNLELKVKDRPPLHGNVEWNNRGTPNTPEQRLSASVRYLDMFAREHALAIQTLQSPQDWGAVQVYSASYLVPLGADRNVSGYVAMSESESQIPEGDASIPGNATIGGLRYTSELKAARQLSVSLDYKHLQEIEATFPDGLTYVVAPPVSYAPVTLGYTGSAGEEDAFTWWSVSIMENIAGMVPGGDTEDFGGDPDDPPPVPKNRDGATGTFFVLRAQASRAQQLDDGFSLSLAASGQLASEPLIAAEQFFAGGIESVRGYMENEALGDHGFRASVELMSPRAAFAQYVRPSRGTMQVGFFMDVAGLWRKDPLPGEEDYRSLVGAGVGARVALGNGLTAKLDQGWALADGTITRRGDTRGHVSVTVEF